MEKSYREGHFVLASGRESDFYFDGRQTALHPEGAWLIGNLFYDLLSDLPKLDAVGGMTLGADPLVSATSVISWTMARPVAAFIVRKNPKGHGTNQYIEGLANLKPGSPVGRRGNHRRLSADRLRKGSGRRFQYCGGVHGFGS